MALIPNDDFFKEESSEALAKDKVEERQRLLSQPPEIAQEKANQTLHPHLWRVSPQPWIETLKPNYDAIDS